eukprot:g4448.t1
MEFSATFLNRDPLRKGAHGGREFVAVRRRVFSMNEDDDVQRDMNSSVIPYRKVVGQRDCKFWAVITSIHPPTFLMEQLVDIPEWCTVVVGDVDSPKDYNVTGNTAGQLVFLTPREQEKLPYKIIPLLKWKHFSRKNIGYLYAMHHGAEVIYDTDDDNLLKRNDKGKFKIPLEILQISKRQDIVTENVKLKEDIHLYNPYESFDPVSAVDKEESLWPRGFPLERIHDKRTTLPRRRTIVKDQKNEDITIIQSLADNNPDVDAVYRLTQRLPINFRSNKKARIEVVPRGVLSPFNAQATIFKRSAFWGLLLPVSVTGRVSDIWRAYSTTRLLWDVGQQIAFASPWVQQCRTPHNYMSDFNAELQLYSQVDQLITVLLEWNPKANNLGGRMKELAIFLYEREFLPNRVDVLLVIAWLQDLHRVGVELPEIDVDAFQPLDKGSMGKIISVSNDGHCEKKLFASPSLWGKLKSDENEL